MAAEACFQLADQRERGLSRALRVGPTAVAGSDQLLEEADELLEKTGMTLEDIDMVVPHQANLRINETFRDRLKLPKEKIYNNIQEYGNTTSATIPIALDEVVEKGILKSGDIVMFIGLGAGLTWGGVIYRLP